MASETLNPSEYTSSPMVVLILVLVEDGFRVVGITMTDYTYEEVLILVLVEDGFRGRKYKYLLTR